MTGGCKVAKDTILSFTYFQIQTTTGRVGCGGKVVGINRFSYRGQCSCTGTLILTADHEDRCNRLLITCRI